jgi:hypothetical protein
LLLLSVPKSPVKVRQPRGKCKFLADDPDFPRQAWQIGPVGGQNSGEDVQN